MYINQSQDSHEKFKLIVKSSNYVIKSISVLNQRSKDIMECYCPHNSVIEEWGGNCSTSDEIVLIFRRFPCQYLNYFTGQNII